MSSDHSKIPRHIAMIMDGNGRWAKARKFGRLSGHRKGADTVRTVVTECRKLGVEVLTLYAFSEENWKRPRTETSALMKILKKFLVSERKLLQENEIRLRTIGDIRKLPSDVLETLHETMKVTQTNSRMTLVLALSYGGRDEILRAVRDIAKKVHKKELSPDAISEETISAALDTKDLPDPDLLIRTSGEFRTSNFLPWQLTYTELYVTSTLWPDFSRQDLHEAIQNFSKRERRFGLTSEQVKKGSASWTVAEL